MKFRATREEIYTQVLKDTAEVLEDYPIKTTGIVVSPSLEELMVTLGCGLDTEDFVGRDNLEQLILEAKDRKSWMEAVGQWIRYLTRYRSHFGEDIMYSKREEEEVRFVLRSSLNEGVLSLSIREAGWTSITVFEAKGRASRLLSKLFGEKVVTELCCNLPLKERNLELHFSKHYIPELYIMMSDGENCSSCMSKKAHTYELPDHLHPVLAYEGSSNAVLALLWDESKGRHIGRAIVALGLHGDESMTYSSCYGSSGVGSLFQQTDLESNDDMEGLELSVIEYEGDYLLPYVDGETQNADLIGDKLVICHSGEYEACHSTGRSQGSSFYCNCCGSDECRGEQYHTDDGVVCERCFVGEYVEVEGVYMNRDRCVYSNYTGGYIPEYDAVYCDYHEEYYPEGIRTYSLRTEHGDVYEVVEPNLEDAIDHYNPVEIDGEPVEQEEEAA